jgi:hypothetical protein
MQPLDFSIGALLRTSLFWLVFPTVVTRGDDNLTVVHLDDGRVLQGTLDVRTDETFLWLRTETVNFSLASRFRWSDVRDLNPKNTGFSDDGQRVEGDVPKGIDAVDQFEPAVDTEGIVVDGETDCIDWPTSLPEISEDVPSDGPLVFPVARALRIEAHLANWDDDVEPDGLRVLVSPVDGLGQVVPVFGSIDFQLIGERRLSRGGEHVRRQDSFPLLGEWSRRVTPKTFGPNGFVYELPFRNFAPGRDVDIAFEALLTARLGIPGVGVLDSSDSYVLLRPTSRFRDDLQFRTGRRYDRREFTRLYQVDSHRGWVGQGD